MNNKIITMLLLCSLQGITLNAAESHLFNQQLEDEASKGFDDCFKDVGCFVVFSNKEIDVMFDEVEEYCHLRERIVRVCHGPKYIGMQIESSVQKLKKAIIVTKQIENYLRISHCSLGVNPECLQKTIDESRICCGSQLDFKDLKRALSVAKNQVEKAIERHQRRS